MASYTAAAMSKYSTMLMVLLLLLIINYSHCYHAYNSDKDGTEQEVIAAPTCKTYECPAYMTVHEEKEFEIRRYSNHTLWVSTYDINVNNSFRQSTRAGFLQLRDYINGNNGKHEEIPITAPVVTDVFLSSRGPSCDTAFVVRMPVAKSFEEIVENDNLSNHSLHAESWDGWCAAVRKFGGFARKDGIVEEAQNLKTSLHTTPWAASVNNITNNNENCLHNEEPSTFQVAQYNSPFGNRTRFNEIWFLWDTSIESNCT